MRFTTTSSDSTEPKSGFSVAVSCRLLLGRQDTHGDPRFVGGLSADQEESKGGSGPAPVNVLMVGTGEYTTGYVGGTASDSDKGAGVVTPRAALPAFP